MGLSPLRRTPGPLLLKQVYQDRGVWVKSLGLLRLLRLQRLNPYCSFYFLLLFSWDFLQKNRSNHRKGPLTWGFVLLELMHLLWHLL